MPADAFVDTDPTAPVEIEFYWRPGCGFCRRLERSLTKSGLRFVKRNIWEDPADAAYVRSKAGGNETVPTVRIGSTTLVNPSAQDVLSVARHEFAGMQLEEKTDNGLLGKMLRKP